MDIHESHESSADLRTSLAARESEVAGLKEQLDIRFREIAVLTRELEKQGAALDRMRQEAELQRLQLEKVVTSTTWRMTGPLRRLIDLLRSRRG
ncbi:hypothetical protein Rumeso_01580 [Rubellimicrobium mesophilum DSM 19309]|uniref:Uncharacterized protein n=1 Tax=Rubellimicrobium mesophilum DSM 19309 TaxID=442562 RepID=A0A017HQ65_9RHOB|nr:hypothetical protein Rumeso_01580 [Rubellimicrobium mesophilum DSM 19309]